MNHPLVTTRRRALGLGIGAVMAGLSSACGMADEATDSASENASAKACASDGTKSITYIGDSLTNGTSQDSGLGARFPAIISRRLLVPARILASNGSGYVQVGPAAGAQTFPGQARSVQPDTSLVLILGSRNDMHSEEDIDEIPERALTTYERVKDRAPNARLLVVGPPWINDSPSAEILAVRDQVRAAAEQAGVDFLDPIREGWFAEPQGVLDDGRSRLIAQDRIHPNDDGHEYLADRLLPYVTERICTP